MSDTSSRFVTIPNEPPKNWDRETPRYRVARDLHPSANSRFRFEPPFSQVMDSSEWQYATRDYRAGEIIEIRDFWPHPSMVALNFAAKKVLQFYNSAPKSRLARSLWAHDRIRLDDGLSSQGPNVAAILAPRPAA
jgi:hypothetical protein